MNVASNRLVPHDLYVPFAIVCSAGLVVLAMRVDGRTRAELGLGADAVASGLRWGAGAIAVVLAAYLVAFALPATRDVFLDDRVEGESLAWVAFAMAIRVPLGTVLLEEVAFRGVLLAELSARTTRAIAVAGSSLLFGLWHVLPALGLETVNPVATDTVGQVPGAVTVVGSVLATALAGVVFCWLRERSGSLLAPMALHWATNALGYGFAYAAWTW